MFGFRWGRRAAPLVFIAALAASAADAATVTLDNVTGWFHFSTSRWDVDHHGVENKSYTQLRNDSRNLGEQFIRRENRDTELWWGNPRTTGTEPWNNPNPLTAAEKRHQSGYVFDGISPSDGFTTNKGVFTFGEFTHYNGAIWSNSASLRSVDFRVRINGTIDGIAFSLYGIIPLFHDETLNPFAPCKSGDSLPCGDDVRVRNSVASSNAVISNGFEYTLQLEGLVQSLRGKPITTFFTDEYDTSSAFLRARLVSKELPPPPPPVVPLPAAGWLLIAGLGGLVAVARRRRDG